VKVCDRPANELVHEESAMRPTVRGHSETDHPRRTLRRIVDIPELNIAIFGFLLNFSWEILQLPLFAGKATAAYWQQVQVCLIATSGDLGILLAAFWSVAAFTGNRAWLLTPRPRDLAGFIGIGITITIVAEKIATEFLSWWAYADAMPIIPFLEVGLSPIAQWLLLPLLLVWFVRRQLT
jgi:hypothetical protein